MSKSKDLEVVTFKVDKSLKKLLAGVSNRSEFIRHAILLALDSTCPFCKGTGVLNEHRKKHWNDLVQSNSLSECDDCHEPLVVCSCDGESSSESGKTKQ